MHRIAMLVGLVFGVPRALAQRAGVGNNKYTPARILEDIGGRIEALDKAANKGVHDDVEVIEMHRLVMGLFLLAHDLLTLRAPDGRAMPSYAGKLETEMVRAIKEAS